MAFSGELQTRDKARNFYRNRIPDVKSKLELNQYRRFGVPDSWIYRADLKPIFQEKPHEHTNGTTSKEVAVFLAGEWGQYEAKEKSSRYERDYGV